MEMTPWAGSFISAALAADGYSFDVEHEKGLGCARSDFQIHGVSFATDGIVRYVTSDREWRPLLEALFAIPELEAVAYNGKYDLRCLEAVGVKGIPEGFRDPMIAVNLLDENRPPNRLGLKIVAADYLGAVMTNYESASSDGLDTERFRRYACDDAAREWELWKLLRPRLEAEGLFKLFRKILCPAAVVFAEMETEGVYWDLKEARRLLQRFLLIRDDAEKVVREFIGPINLNSPQQVSDALFERLGLPTVGVPKTKAGTHYKVDNDVLARLARRWPACAALATYRTASKMISTYVEPLSRAALADERCRVRPTIWLVSATGRTRESDPNLQNVPVRLPKEFNDATIRRAIAAPPGRVLLVADFSQIELRFVAHVSGDLALRRAYTQWRCSCGRVGESKVILHECPGCGMPENPELLTSETAVGFWHGLDVHQQTADLVPALGGSRQHGKTCNFALVYCATASKMNSEYPLFSVVDWEEIIEQYFGPKAYVSVREWHVRMESLMYQTGVVKDLFGRKRRIPAVEIRRSPKHALNQFVNFVPQASACELAELSLVNFRRRALEEGLWRSAVWPQNFVHDEFIFEVDESRVESVVPLLRDAMELSVSFEVPMRADIKVVRRWSEAK